MTTSRPSLPGKNLIYWHPSRNPAPELIREAGDYRGETDLCVQCTQLPPPYTPKQQQAIVKAWCELFSRPTPVRRLWLVSRVPQPLFDAVCQQTSLEALYVKWSGVSDLASLPGLRSLRHLYFGSSGGITDLAPLGELAALGDLFLENFQKVNDYRAIGRLSNLRDLAIEGDVFGPRKITIASLAFVTRLEHLECLRVQVARLVDPSCRSLLKLTRLRHLDLPSPRDPELMATLQRALPGLESGNVHDPPEPSTPVSRHRRRS